jgi:hypothetical protein
VPYSVRIAANGALIAVGLEDGTLLLFAPAELHSASSLVSAALAGKRSPAEAPTLRWQLLWRRREHSKELRDACFSADNGTLSTPRSRVDLVARRG